MNLPKLIAVDLDGTLLCPRRSLLPAAHRRCIKAIRSRGIQVALVTGRPMLTSKPVWQQLQLDTPIVCFNGAWLAYPDTKPIYHQTLTAPDVQDIVKVLKAFPGSISAYPNENTWCMHALCPRTANWPDIYDTTIHIKPQMFEQWEHTSPKVLFACEPEIIDQVMRAVSTQFAERFHVVKSQADRFEIQKPVNKAIGLHALAQHLHIKQAEIWAVGDAANDLEMLAWAGVGLAMGHATHQVKAAADIILPSIEAHGMAMIPHHLDRL